MTINGPIIVTERLILRPPSAEDFDAWAEFGGDKETNRFLGGPGSRAACWRDLCTMAGAWHIRGFAMFSVIERESGRWVGRIGPWHPEGWPAREVGWGVSNAFAGKGYAYEAALASIDYAIDVLGWDDVIHCIDPENARSIALAQRLGSVNRGPTRLPEPYQDARVDAWGQRAAEWRARRAQTVEPPLPA